MHSSDSEKFRVDEAYFDNSPEGHSAKVQSAQNVRYVSLASSFHNEGQGFVYCPYTQRSKGQVPAFQGSG